LAVNLNQRYKRGVSTGNLRQIRAFYLYFQNIEIQQTVFGESSRLAQLAKIFPPPWSVRQLDRQITTQFYERTLLSHDKTAMLQQVARTVADVTPEQAIRGPFTSSISVSMKSFTERLSQWRHRARFGSGGGGNCRRP
jgi:hypothetical protein